MKNVIFYNHLIRDNIPQILSEDGILCVTKKIEDTQAIATLIDSLKTKVNNLSDSAHFLSELVDVIDLAETLGKTVGISKEEIDMVKDDKKKIEGSFDGLLFLVRTSDA